MRTYAIGDIHGHLSLLQDIHDRIARDRRAVGDAEAPVVHIGDLVDRGPDSRGVVEYLRLGIEGGENWVVLKGNHDRMFAGFLRDHAHHDPGLRRDLSWLHPRLGGGPTLESYGVHHAADRPLGAVYEDAVALVPPEHIAFIEALPCHYRRDGAIFVHAGIRPGIALEEQQETDLCWIREPFLSDPRDHGALVVHGHTAIDAVSHYGNRLNLDTGAAYGGPLSAVVIEGRSVWLLGSEGRIPIV
ncbi:metallophosphoesterase [Cereibacter sphaeroides]|uniref:metallophosphoesterase n=1 Tax=Cereibacter sphaeroides TaxID=1063 RepID=UPI001F2CA927|nr:metallophosphoesterase [Cereibacter sphaeroides]MCE6960904.1 metallophosphoesterase [Cereibacter sphaeroides]MCE6969798.1 metallophosphoesterase [Cereibacter sphaeroides]MCE6975273.1 metallophosphoesterase [Cereibacter sphaeroides]